MASCVPVSQRPLSQEMKGSSDTAWMRPGNEQELEGGLTESSAPCQSLLASSWAVPGAQPCALTEPRGSLQEDGTQHRNTTRSWTHQQSWLTGTRHWGWVSMLVPQDGVSRQARVRSWEILWTKASSADTGSVCCLWDAHRIPHSSRADGVWGRLAPLRPHAPLVPSSARLLAADRVAVALWHDRSLALAR